MLCLFYVDNWMYVSLASTVLQVSGFECVGSVHLIALQGWSRRGTGGGTKPPFVTSVNVGEYIFNINLSKISRYLLLTHAMKYNCTTISMFELVK